MSDINQDLLTLNQRLLDAITQGDWAVYQELCDPSITALEPEVPGGHIVTGLPFHRYYFDLGGVRGRHQTTMVSPNVRVLGDVAILAYTRLVQRLSLEGMPVTVASAETRIWHKRQGTWKNVHFHRTPLAS